MSIRVYKVSAVETVRVTDGVQLDQIGPLMLNATPSKMLLYPGNTHTLQVAGVLDGSTLNFWNASGSISGTLVDSNGNAVPECNGVILQYVPGSNGVFSASFGDFNFQPAIGTQYTLLIDGIQNGVTMHMEILVEIALRAS